MTEGMIREVAPRNAVGASSRDLGARGAILRYSADRRTLAFTAVFFVLVAAQWNLDLSWPARLVVFALACTFGFAGAVATHNTVHTPVFYNNLANRVFKVILSCHYGQPVTVFVPVHNLSHHKWTQSPRDITRSHKARYSWHLLNLLFAGSTWGGAALRDDIRYLREQRRLGRRIWNDFVWEAAGVLTFVAVLVLINPWKFLFCWLLPTQFGQWAITAVNFIQHDGCDDDQSGYNHSRNFVGPIFNLLLFNNGYHTIHHMRAGLHWSVTPEHHARLVRPHIHAALEEPNLLAYLWRTFISPGVRVRYDGTPLVLPPPVPDEPWLFTTDETSSG
jgi:fatty acid desaturase